MRIAILSMILILTIFSSLGIKWIFNLESTSTKCSLSQTLSRLAAVGGNVKISRKGFYSQKYLGNYKKKHSNLWERTGKDSTIFQCLLLNSSMNFVERVKQSG